MAQQLYAEASASERAGQEEAAEGAERQRFVVEFEAAPGDAGIAAVRKLLKFVLRVCGLKCTATASPKRSSHDRDQLVRRDQLLVRLPESLACLR